MVFHRSLGDIKSPKISRTLLSILADLNNSVVRMVSTRFRIFKSSSPYTNPLVTVSSAPITIGITVTFILYSFFCSLARSRYLLLFLLYSLSVFHTNVRWWSFTGVWVTASFLGFPELFSVFWPILTMLDSLDSSSNVQLL